MGKLWQEKLENLAGRHSKLVCKAEGDGFLGTLFFADAEQTVKFCKKLNGYFHIDISAQTYKADCPPAALTKFPLIASEELLEFAAKAMEETLIQMELENK